MASLRLRRRPGFDLVLGRYHGTAGRHAFARHTHDELVLGANLAGAEWIRLDRHALVACEGDITLYNPAQVQEGGALTDAAPWCYISFHVDSAHAHRLLTGMTGELEFDAALLSSSAALPLFQTVAARFDDGEDEMLDEFLAQILGRLAVEAGAANRSWQSRTLARADRRLRRVAERLRTCLDDAPPLAELARDAGLSVEHLVRSFSAAFGLPPMAWARQRRLCHGRDLLRRGHAPADVAAQLGFADQSHFHRAFKGAYGLTPRHFARAAN